jgi:TonB family protein
MCCQNFWKKLIPFALTFLLGLTAASLLSRENSPLVNSAKIKRPDKAFVWRDEEGFGTGSSCNIKKPDGEAIPRSGTNKIFVISKPRANYTDAARTNETQGVIRLRVTFLASGEIGAITPVNSLPDGLTEQAIAAARNIKFEPATRDGVPTAVTKIVEYTFTLY